MSKHSKIKTYYCLNRIMLAEGKSPDKINPFRIIRKFFDFGNLCEIKELFLKYCKASLAAKYSWKEGAPGKLLYFNEQLEILIEACYLIYIKKGFKRIPSETNKSLMKGKGDMELEYTGSLSLEQFMNPSIIIHDFFELHSLMEWKKITHDWLESALSNFSVMDNIEPEDLLEYYSNMEKLLEASSRITFQKKNNSGLKQNENS